MIRKIIKKYNIYILIFSILYLFQRFIFLDFLSINKILVFKYFYVHEFVFIVTSFFITKHLLKIEHLGLICSSLSTFFPFISRLFLASIKSELILSRLSLCCFSMFLNAFILSKSPEEEMLNCPLKNPKILYLNLILAPFINKEILDKTSIADIAPVIISTGPAELKEAFITKSSGENQFLIIVVHSFCVSNIELMNLLK